MNLALRLPVKILHLPSIIWAQEAHSSTGMPPLGPLVPQGGSFLTGFSAPKTVKMDPSGMPFFNLEDLACNDLQEGLPHVRLRLRDFAFPHQGQSMAFPTQLG